MKKLLVFAVGAALLVSAVANAQTQTAVGNPASVSAVAGSSGSGSGSAGPAIIVSPGMPTPIVPPPIQPSSGFIQFDNLTVQNVSAANPPAEIMATNQSMIYPPVPAPEPVPMMNNGTGSMPTPSTAPATAPSITCYSFDSESAANGTAIPCPTPPAAGMSTIAPSTTTPASPSAAMPMIPTTPGNVATGTVPAPAIARVLPYPIQINPPSYTIEIGVSTELYLRDRTAATLGDFAPGDQINVFGYYNPDGSVQAYLVRDLSKPAQNEFLQLNNVDLVSISTSTTPATLVVAQQTIYPCYGFDANGNNKQGIACPMGATGATPNSAVQNAQVPTALMPTWNTSRKYVVTVDAQTILLDSNRTQLQLSNLQVGDELNVYGETSDNGQTVAADIVRDLSIPATAQTYNGTVTQMNPDGSFVVQTDDGRTITVQNPVKVGAALQLTGVLDRLQNVLSQVTSITSSGMTVMPPIPATAN